MSSAPARNAAPIDMFGEYPAIMDGGITGYNQFQKHFAPQARLIKTRLNLPISTFDLTAHIWTTLKYLNAKAIIDQSAGSDEIRLNAEATGPQKEQYRFVKQSEDAPKLDEYVLVLCSATSWKFARVKAIDHERREYLLDLGIDSRRTNEEMEKPISFSSKSKFIMIRKVEVAQSCVSL